MRLSKKLVVGCLVISFVLLSGGCSTLSDLFAENKPENSEVTKNSQISLQRQEKQNEIKDLKTRLENQQRNLTEERKICDEMTAKTIKAKKDPKNQNESPQTFAQCQKVGGIEATIRDIQGKIEKAEQELAATVPSPQISPQENNSQESSNLINLLPLGFAGIVGLSLLGGLYWLFNRNFKREQEATASGFNAVRSEQKEIKKQIKQLNETVKLQNDRIERQQSIIHSLQKQSTVASSIGYAAQPQQSYEQPQVYKPEPQFPVSAEDYLNKVGNNAQKASADLIGGLLVQDPNKNQEFLIVKDNSLTDGLFYAVPSFHRFSTKHDYMTYYQNYYACENPSGGAVWILSPTTVRRVEGGWKLVDMGELEIR